MTPPIATAVAAGIPSAQHGKALLEKPGIAQDEDEKLVINTIRCLAADLCQQFKGGHPGTVLGAATIAVALWRRHMRYNPANPDWLARDRFVLSAGHACLLQYLMLHFSGYSAWTLDAIKQYHAPVTDGIAAGHPEIEYPGIELTTGPLGQGIANAVGLAMAGKSLASRYNKPGLPLFEGKIWCFTGDGCLQEGVGQEALSLAGHFGLDNLILIYDNNSVTVDGPIDSCFTDDTSSKLRAMKWHVIDVFDGSNDLEAVSKAMGEAKSFSGGKPVCLNIRTIIGIGSQNQGQGKVHGQALGNDDVEQLKRALGFDPQQKFVVPYRVREYFAECKTRGSTLEHEWNELLKRYQGSHPEDAKQLDRRIRGQLAPGWEAKVPTKAQLPKEAQPTRKSSGIMVQALVPEDVSFMVGSADLLESTFVSWKDMVEFQDPKSGLGQYQGRQIRFGIREHAMVALGNGLSAYQKGMFLPVMSTFFMFWLYAAPAVRMAALQRLRFIGIATHDSIGIGEDGPTHQPVALASFYRALPNLNFIRPADAEEVIGAWLLALGDKYAPSIFALSRQPVPLLEGSDRSKVSRGAYIIKGIEGETPDITLVSTGSEVSRTMEVAIKLEQKLGHNVRVVSMPSTAHFDRQSTAYRQSVLPTRTGLVVAIEAWASMGWARYAHAGCHMHTFGLSAPQALLYDHFGFGVDNLAEKIAVWAESKRMTPSGWAIPCVGEYDDLLLGYVSGQ